MATIRIAAWNANGLLQHVHELELFLWDQKIDICLISESHLTKENHININGYKVYHTIHPNNTTRGGSAVIIKNNVKHCEDVKYEISEIQATAIKIVQNLKNILLLQLIAHLDTR